MAGTLPRPDTNVEGVDGDTEGADIDVAIDDGVDESAGVAADVGGVDEVQDASDDDVRTGTISV